MRCLVPKVSVDHTTNLSLDDAFSKIKTFFETDQDIRRLDSKIKCDFSADSKSGKVIGSQFKANVTVKEHNQGSIISVVVDLPLLLAPFKSKVQETIEKKLAKYLV